MAQNGVHDDLVAAAAADLPETDRSRAFDAVIAFQHFIKELINTNRLCGSVANELRMEAAVKADVGDPAHKLFTALAEAWELREAVRPLDPDRP